MFESSERSRWEKRTVSMKGSASPHVPPPRIIPVLLSRFAPHWIVRQQPSLARSAAEAEAALVVVDVVVVLLRFAAAAVVALAAAAWISSS